MAKMEMVIEVYVGEGEKETTRVVPKRRITAFNQSNQRPIETLIRNYLCL